MDQLRPRQEVRRFDVFAEYHKQEQEAAGVPAPYARGYGLWVAKVVASRRFGGAKNQVQAPPSLGNEHGASSSERPAAKEWHELNGEPQTDALFEHEIVARMGQDFYDTVFVPAIRAARAQGQSYETIRDRIRREWKPALSNAR